MQRMGQGEVCVCGTIAWLHTQCCDMQHEGHPFLIKCKVKAGEGKVWEQEGEERRRSGTKMRPVDHSVNCRPQDG